MACSSYYNTVDTSYKGTEDSSYDNSVDGIHDSEYESVVKSPDCSADDGSNVLNWYEDFDANDTIQDEDIKEFQGNIDKVSPCGADYSTVKSVFDIGYCQKDKDNYHSSNE